MAPVALANLGYEQGIGYPRCIVQRFAAAREQTDRSLECVAVAQHLLRSLEASTQIGVARPNPMTTLSSCSNGTSFVPNSKPSIE